MKLWRVEIPAGGWAEAQVAGIDGSLEAWLNAERRSRHTYEWRCGTLPVPWLAEPENARTVRLIGCPTWKPYRPQP